MGGLDTMVQKRNNKFSPLLWNAAGLCIFIAVGSKVAWGTWYFPELSGNGTPPVGRAFEFVLLLALPYGLASLLVWKYLRYPRVGRFSCLFLCSASVWVSAVFCIAMLQLYYSRPFLILGFLFQMIWCFAAYRLFLDPARLRLAIAPGGVADILAKKPLCNWEILKKPVFPDLPIDGLVIDLHRNNISPEWICFIAECSMKRIPLFHAATMYENLTGRVCLDHMSKDILREMAVPRIYTFLKHPFDLFIVSLTLPVWLPLLGIVALLVRLASGHPVFFRQERIGRFGQPFTILKFRSLETAEDGVVQSTPIGGFLRKHRLDELPQLFNVIKGEMSLVGPRPEQTALVSKYEAAIPFYAFRAALRPGITGWAQVCWKYADNTDDTRIKLEYDIFYLKRFSFWLDLLILAKTIRTILFGAGSGNGR